MSQAQTQVPRPVEDGWIQTFSGRKVYPMDLTPDDIHIRDIAHSLAHQCRFAGHVSRFYSVAQHSVIMSRLVPREHAMWALLHDASEAYLTDIPRPIKHLPAFAFYRAAEARAMATICRVYGLSIEAPACVKDIDIRMCATEAQALMQPLHPHWKVKPPAVPLLDVDIIPTFRPDQAEVVFLHTFRDLGGRQK